jgi:hypothetical protein
MAIIPKGGHYQSDGSITFIMRGEPPPCNDPMFEVDPFDDHRWIQKYCQCKLREVGRIVKCPKNGKERKIDFCRKLGLAINARYCNDDCNVPIAERR